MEGVDESAPYSEHFEAHYPETKSRAERLLLAASGEGLHTAALRPHFIRGPRDTSVLPRLIQRSRTGGASARRVTGNAYFISSGQPIPLWEMIDHLLVAAGEPRVTRSASPRTALVAS